MLTTATVLPLFTVRSIQWKRGDDAEERLWLLSLRLMNAGYIKSEQQEQTISLAHWAVTAVVRQNEGGKEWREACHRDTVDVMRSIARLLEQQQASIGPFGARMWKSGRRRRCDEGDVDCWCRTLWVVHNVLPLFHAVLIRRANIIYIS